jgi:hypothetical protein
VLCARYGQRVPKNLPSSSKFCQSRTKKSKDWKGVFLGAPLTSESLPLMRVVEGGSGVGVGGGDGDDGVGGGVGGDGGGGGVGEGDRDSDAVISGDAGGDDGEMMSVAVMVEVMVMMVLAVR